MVKVELQEKDTSERIVRTNNSNKYSLMITTTATTKNIALFQEQ